MKILMFSSKPSSETTFNAANRNTGHDITYIEPKLSVKTAALAKGFDGVCLFVNDSADAQALKILADCGIRLVAMRCAGFNNVDINEAHRLGMCVCRVPAYSPYAVAEHAVALMLALNRKIPRAHFRVRDGNFSLEGLLGFDMHGKTAGVVGTGKIGAIVARILNGFGCRVLVADPYKNPDLEGVAAYVELDNLLASSDIVTLHCPLTSKSKHMINFDMIKRMKPGVMIINTSRGALVDTRSVIAGLKLGQIGYLGLDVYEEEADLFFEDLSGSVLQDDQFARLLTFPNVLITAHQAFFTKTALENIADTTIANITAFERDGLCQNEIKNIESRRI